MIKRIKDVIKRALFTIAALAVLVSIVPTNVQAQGETSIVDEVNSSLEVIDTKRQKIAELRKRKADLEKENTELTLEIVNLNETIDLLEAQSIEQDQDSNNVQVEFEGEQKNKVALKKDIAAKESKKQANIEQIQAIDDEIAQIQGELNTEVSQFRGEIVTGGATTVSYLLLIILFWVGYEVLFLILKRFTPQSWHGFIRFVLIMMALLASIIVIFVALAARIEFLFASLGVVSAALVVELQDMVSSFFAWMLILIQHQYRKDHIIRIGQDTDAITGVVTKVGFLRTYMNERVGVKSDIHFEQSTGKVVSFPNNKIFTSPLINFSVNDPYLWYSLSLTITFESDANLAYSVLNEFVQNWYESTTDIKGAKRKAEHSPKVFVNIAGDGPNFTIWYSAKIGNYRVTLRELSLELLEVLKKNNIELAYATVRTVGGLEISKS